MTDGGLARLVPTPRPISKPVAAARGTRGIIPPVSALDAYLWLQQSLDGVSPMFPGEVNDLTISAGGGRFPTRVVDPEQTVPQEIQRKYYKPPCGNHRYVGRPIGGIVYRSDGSSAGTCSAHVPGDPFAPFHYDFECKNGVCVGTNSQTSLTPDGICCPHANKYGHSLVLNRRRSRLQDASRYAFVINGVI